MKFFIIVFFTTTILMGYQWPIADVDSQHTIWGTYGEVRSKWVDDGWLGYWIYRDHVHDGIDIDKEGNSIAAVYPVESGTIVGEQTSDEKVTVIDSWGYYYTYSSRRCTCISSRGHCDGW